MDHQSVTNLACGAALPACALLLAAAPLLAFATDRRPHGDQWVAYMAVIFGIAGGVLAGLRHRPR